MSYKKDIIKLYSEGKSYSQIAKELGCNKATVSYHLGAGQKEKTLQRTRDIRNNIVKYIQDYKQNSVCMDCRENYPYWMLEFDHVGDDKKFNIGKFRHSTASIDDVKKEIEKCEVVCSNCHKNRTFLRLLKTGNSSPNISKYYN